MKMKMAAALAVLITASGCADQMLSNDRIRSNTAMALGQPDSAVVIADRRYDGATNTYYTARTPRGAYHCRINGGGLLAMGMTNAPQCSKN
jgi:hypothetical protein